MPALSIRKAWVFALASLTACAGSAAPPETPRAKEPPAFEVAAAGSSDHAAAVAGAPRRAAPLDADQEEPEDTKNYRVPIEGSPVRGKATALVTMVIFSDFQCPYCARVEPTIAELMKEYGDKIRIVWKNNPLSFHPRAEPAAELALAARAQKGDAGFWAVHDLIFAASGKLDDQDLEAIATRAGLDAAAAMKSVRAHKHQASIAEDLELGDDVQADGTPHFFINGRRLIGAQPIEVFRPLIDKQLAEAEALVHKGTAPAKVYEALQTTAVSAVALETVRVPPPTRDNPTRGPENAKVLVHVFSDFQCPYCARVEPTLRDLDTAFPGKIRFVWHNLPLPFHKNAEPAAETAMEAFAQKGGAGFWAMHDLLFAAQDQPGGLERQGLEAVGQRAGLDVNRLRAALDAKAHQRLIEADQRVAEGAGINGTPGFVINGYKLSGAQPLGKFVKLVKLALAAP